MDGAGGRCGDSGYCSCWLKKGGGVGVELEKCSWMILERRGQRRNGCISIRSR